MIKKIILISFIIFISSFSFSVSNGIIYKTDEFDNVTYFLLNIVAEYTKTEYNGIQLIGKNDKVNSKCWTENSVTPIFFVYDDIFYSEWNKLEDLDISNISLSIDGKVYNDLINKDKFIEVLKKIKTTSKVRIRIYFPEGHNETVELEKKDIKYIKEFFDKECKIK